MSRKVCDGHPDGNGGTYHHSDDSADCDNSHTESYCPGDHYDLYVTARLPGCENWSGESGATEQTVAQWEELCSPSYTGESEVMEQYLQELQAATLNDDWEGWSEVNIEWTKVLYQTDWEDLYGVTVTQVALPTQTALPRLKITPAGSPAAATELSLYRWPATATYPVTSESRMAGQAHRTGEWTLPPVTERRSMPPLMAWS